MIFCGGPAILRKPTIFDRCLGGKEVKNEKAAVNPENLWAMTTGASFDGKNNL